MIAAMFGSKLVGGARLALAAGKAALVGHMQGLVGREIDLYGRRLGLRLLARHAPGAWDYLLNPVACVRYFEYDFTRRHLPNVVRHGLDLSSPRLFSFWALETHRVGKVLMCNPDRADLDLTRAIAQAIGLSRLSMDGMGLDGLVRMDTTFDAIWSISVLEHVAGEYDDSTALSWIWDRLAPGGRLIITVPIDRKAWTEYRDQDCYGTQAGRRIADGVFFQRWYDEAAIQSRIIRPIGTAPVARGYYGERVPGHFHDYHRRWLAEGLATTVHDPAMMVQHYREFPSAADMPGCGVTGLVFEKAAIPAAPALCPGEDASLPPRPGEPSSTTTSARWPR